MRRTMTPEADRCGDAGAVHRLRARACCCCRPSRSRAARPRSPRRSPPPGPPRPPTRAAERRVSFDDLPPLGPPGREVSRQRIADMDVTIVRFANGSTLTFKQTDFEHGTVNVPLRFGHGMAGLPPDRKSLAWLGPLVAPSGVAVSTSTGWSGC